jgi:hypothetical protein
VVQFPRDIILVGPAVVVVIGPVGLAFRPVAALDMAADGLAASDLAAVGLVAVTRATAMALVMSMALLR